MQNHSTPPWYKQFWPWFLITIPVISIILSFTILTLAVNTKDSLVVDDYYKEGKGINLQLKKVQEAKVRNIQTRLEISQQNVKLTFLSGQPETGAALMLNFHHSTLQERDFSLMLTSDAAGNYRGSFEQDQQGKWTVSLQPVDGLWRFSNVLVLPSQEAFEFNP